MCLPQVALACNIPVTCILRKKLFSIISLSLNGGPSAKHCCKSNLPITHFIWNLSLFKTEIHNTNKTCLVERVKWHLSCYSWLIAHTQLVIQLRICLMWPLQWKSWNAGLLNSFQSNRESEITICYIYFKISWFTTLFQELDISEGSLKFTPGQNCGNQTCQVFLWNFKEMKGTNSNSGTGRMWVWEAEKEKGCTNILFLHFLNFHSH